MKITNRELNEASRDSSLSLQTLDESSRRQSLKIKHDKIISNIETTKFGWLHVKSLLTYSIGFFTVKPIKLFYKTFF